MSEQLEPLATEAGQQAIVRAINNLSSLEYAVRAEHAATEAAQSADEALTSATNASNSESKARDWAEKTNGAVETETIITPPETEGDPPTEQVNNYYSAKYWALLAQDYFNQFELDTVPTEDSTNGITSGAVYDALLTKQNTLTFDNTPTQNSVNPVKSGGVYSALAGKQDTLTIDSTPTQNSTNPVQSGGVYTALSNVQSSLTFDDAPTSGSNNPVKSGGIYTALSGKQDTLTIDSAPTQNSTNPVQSGGVYTAIANATPNITTDTEPTEDSENLITSGAVWDALQNFTPSGGGGGAGNASGIIREELYNGTPQGNGTLQLSEPIDKYDFIEFRVVNNSGSMANHVVPCYISSYLLLKTKTIESGLSQQSIYIQYEFGSRWAGVQVDVNDNSKLIISNANDHLIKEVYGIKFSKNLSEQMYSNVLYENTGGLNSGNVTLSDSIENYDFLCLVNAYSQDNPLAYTNHYMDINDVKKDYTKQYSFATDSSRFIVFSFPNTSTFKVERSGGNQKIYKIIGYKMAKGGYSGIVSDARMTVKSGTAIFPAMSSNQSYSQQVVFDSPMADANYDVVICKGIGKAYDNQFWEEVDNASKTANGFTITGWCSHNIEAGLGINWIAIRPNSYTREGMVEDVLFYNSSGATGIINLSHNMSDYDLLLFYNSPLGGNGYYRNSSIFTPQYLQGLTDTTAIGNTFVLNEYDNRYVKCAYVNDTTINAFEQNGGSKIEKIIGIKFGRYVSGVAVDTTVTQNSDAVITSGAVYNALQNVAPSITIDSSVTQNGTNAVSGSAVYTAIQTAINSITNANGVSY